MSLWKVPDQQTKELMIDFYNHMLAGKPKAEALRRAQLNMKKKYQSIPLGCIIYQGNPGPLSKQNQQIISCLEYHINAKILER